MPSTRLIAPLKLTNFNASQFDDVGAINNGPHCINLDAGWEKSYSKR